MSSKDFNFNQVYNDYLIYAKNRHKKQSFITISQDFNKHVLPYFKDKKISELTKLDVINWQNDILSKNYSNKYNAKLYYVFNDFINYCVNCDYIQENVVSKVGSFKKKVEYKEHQVYTLKQFYWFILHLDNYVIREYFTFMYFYGTRPGEAKALRFIDIDKKYLHINHSLTCKGRRELDTPKNQSSIRTLKIGIITRLRILFLRRYYKRKYGYFNKDFYVFGGLNPIAATTIDRYKKNACEKAKIKCITQHEFRHSYATRMVSKGKPINYVSKTLGHSRKSTTLDIYTH